MSSRVERSCNDHGELLPRGAHDEPLRRACLPVLDMSAGSGERAPAPGSPKAPPPDTIGRLVERRRDTGDRAHHVRFEVSPKTLVALVLVVASLWLLIQLWPVLLVVVVALLVAGTLSPAVRWLEGKGVRRGFGIAIVFTAFFILALLAIFLTIPTLVLQATALVENEPALRARLADYLATSHLSARSPPGFATSRATR